MAAVRAEARAKAEEAQQEAAREEVARMRAQAAAARETVVGARAEAREKAGPDSSSGAEVPETAGATAPPATQPSDGPDWRFSEQAPTPHLVSLLRSEHFQVRDKALKALAVRVGGINQTPLDEAQARAAFLAGAMSHLAPMLTCDSPHFDEGATLFALVSSFPMIRKAMVRPGENWQAMSQAISGLVKVLDCGKAPPRIKALRLSLRALWTLALDQKYAREAIVVEGGVASTVKLLRSPEPLVVTAAAKVLHRLSLANPGHQSVLVAAGAIEPLVSLLDSTDDSLLRRAAETLWVLAESSTTQEVLGRSGAITPLISMLGRANPDVRKTAAILLLNLGNHEPNRYLIAREGAIVPLMGLVKDADLNIACIGLGAMHNLALEAPLREKILAAGAMGLLGTPPVREGDPPRGGIPNSLKVDLRTILSRRDVFSGDLFYMSPKYARAYETTSGNVKLLFGPSGPENDNSGALFPRWLLLGMSGGGVAMLAWLAVEQVLRQLRP